MNENPTTTFKRFPYILRHFIGKKSYTIGFFDSVKEYGELVEAGVIKPIDDLDSGVYIFSEVRAKGRAGLLIWRIPRETPSKAKRRVRKKLVSEGGLQYWVVDKNVVETKEKESGKE